MQLETYVETIKQRFPQVAIQRTNLLTHGTDHDVVEVNDEWMFLFPRDSSVATKLLTQMQVLPELARTLSTAPIPAFEYVWAGGQEYAFPFGGYRKLRGLPLDDESITLIQMEKLMAPLVTFFNELHQFPVSRAKQLGVRDGKAVWQKRFEQIAASVFPLLDHRQREKATARWEHFFTNKAYTTFQSVLTHRDLGGDHILCTPEHGHITGILDWGDLAIGDPAHDFVRLVAERGKAFVERLLTGYRGEVNASFWQRVDFYLYDYPPYACVLKAIRRGNPGHLKYWLECLRTELDK